MDISTEGVPMGLVVAVAAVVLVGGGAAGAYVAFVDSGPQAPYDSVPSGTDGVVVVDGEVVTHATTEQAMDSVIEQQQTAAPGAEQPESYSEMLDQFEEESGLDARGLTHAIAFYQYPDEDAEMGAQPSFGVVATAEWSEDEFTTSLEEEDTEYETTTYNGATLYVDEPDYEYGTTTYVAILDDGTYAFAESEDVIHDIVDTHNGDAEAFSGDVRDAAESQNDDALVWYASSVPDDAVPQQSNGEVDVTQFNRVNVVSGSYYAVDDSTVGFETTMHAEDEDAAGDVYDVVDGGISLASGSVDNETLDSALDRVEVEQSGSEVTVSYEDDLSNVEEVMTAFTGMSSASDSESGSDSQYAPVVQFNYEYDAEASQVTVTHEGGDSIAVDSLGVQTATNEELEYTTTASEDLTAGDTLTVENVEAGDYIYVTWTTDDGSQSVIGAYEVPAE